MSVANEVIGRIDRGLVVFVGVAAGDGPADIDYITSKANGVKLSINQGAGLGRVIDATLYDPSIPQTP